MTIYHLQVQALDREARRKLKSNVVEILVQENDVIIKEGNFIMPAVLNSMIWGGETYFNSNRCFESFSPRQELLVRMYFCWPEVVPKSPNVLATKTC